MPWREGGRNALCLQEWPLAVTAVVFVTSSSSSTSTSTSTSSSTSTSTSTSGEVCETSSKGELQEQHITQQMQVAALC